MLPSFERERSRERVWREGIERTKVNKFGSHAVKRPPEVPTESTFSKDRRGEEGRKQLWLSEWAQVLSLATPPCWAGLKDGRLARCRIWQDRQAPEYSRM
jgi:hypothetical protein